MLMVKVDLPDDERGDVLPLLLTYEQAKAVHEQLTELFQSPCPFHSPENEPGTGAPAAPSDDFLELLKRIQEKEPEQQAMPVNPLDPLCFGFPWVTSEPAVWRHPHYWIGNSTIPFSLESRG